MISRSLIIIALVFGITGCKEYTINAEHAKTSKGYINSGLRLVGDVFLYDTSSNKIVHLKTLLVNTKDIWIAKTLNARGLGGASVEGTVEKNVEVKIKSEVANNAYVELKNVSKRSADIDGYQILVNKINSVNNIERERLVHAWSLNDSIRKDSPFRYIVVVSNHVADEAQFKYENNYLVSGQFTPIKTISGEMGIRINGFSDQNMSGTKVPVLISIDVYKASLKEGNYFFKNVGADSKKIVEAWQNN